MSAARGANGYVMVGCPACKHEVPDTLPRCPICDAPSRRTRARRQYLFSALMVTVIIAFAVALPRKLTNAREQRERDDVIAHQAKVEEENARILSRRAHISQLI